MPVDGGSDADITAAIDWYAPSPDGRLVVYGRSTGGDELSTLHVVDVGSGAHLDDRIPHTRACSVAWLDDGTAFAYTRYPEPGTVPAGEEEYGRRVFWHRLGDDWRVARAALTGRLGTIALHRPPAEAPASGAGAPHGFRRPLEKVAF